MKRNVDYTYQDGTLNLYWMGPWRTARWEEDLEWYKEFIKKYKPTGISLALIHGEMYRIMKKQGKI